MSNVFNGYKNLLNATSNVVVHEWTFDLNTSFENLNFKIVGSSIMMHSHCLEISLYVLMTYAIFQLTIIMCIDNGVKAHYRVGSHFGQKNVLFFWYI
jgi:hypothetical protein